MNQQALMEDLIRDEALRFHAYDDANGEPLRPGYTLKGHPTIGIGRALDTNGVSVAEAYQLCNNDIESIVKELTARVTWFASLDDPRQRVLCNIAFNAGVNGLLQFHEMLAAFQGHDYIRAAHCLMQSRLAATEKIRAGHLRELLLSGINV